MAAENDPIKNPQEPVDETQAFVKPVPSFDEEHGTYFSDDYEQDVSRLERAYVDPEPGKVAPIPHINDEDGSGHRVPGEGRSRAKGRPVLAFLLVAFMVVGIAAAGTYGLELWGGVSVPNVLGLTEANARTALENKGFEVELRSQIADDAIGTVLEQEPGSGARRSAGSSVTITVATNREMPDVVGLTEEAAKDLLKKAGAGDIRIDYHGSEEQEGLVLAVVPGVGEPFTAHQTIVLTVSRKPVVPNVIGMSKVEAIAVIENAGFKADTKLVVSDATPNTVVEQDPAADTKLDPGSTVMLSLAQPMPDDPLSLTEYFDKSSSSIATYLEEQGFKLQSGYVDYDGYAEAVYLSESLGTLRFTARPYSHLIEESGTEDVLRQDRKFRGIRWDVPASKLPANASSLESAVPTEELMRTCGFSNIVDVCSQSDVVIPEEARKTKAQFRCTYGEQGSNSWTVLIVNENGSTRAAVTVAPKSYYTEWHDLAPYGNSICDMIAYSDVYTELDEEDFEIDVSESAQ